MKYFMRCNKCGWHKESNYIMSVNCPDCGNQLVIVSEGEDKEIANMLDKPHKKTDDLTPKKFKVYNYLKKIDKADLEIMKYTIKKFGNDNTWHKIEAIPELWKRLEDRRLFFKAGGHIPNRKIGEKNASI